jgi:hypothetical protein
MSKFLAILLVAIIFSGCSSTCTKVEVSDGAVTRVSSSNTYNSTTYNSTIEKWEALVAASNVSKSNVSKSAVWKSVTLKVYPRTLDLPLVYIDDTTKIYASVISYDGMLYHVSYTEIPDQLSVLKIRAFTSEEIPVREIAEIILRGR